MIKITIEDINRKSPYKIILNNGDLDFTTDSGTKYSVSFFNSHHRTVLRRERQRFTVYLRY